MYTDPADQRHKKLKQRKNTRYQTHSPLFHFRLIQTVGKRNRKSVHCQAHTRHNTVKEKAEVKHYSSSTARKILGHKRCARGNSFYHNRMQKSTVFSTFCKIPTAQRLDCAAKCQHRCHNTYRDYYACQIIHMPFSFISVYSLSYFWRIRVKNPDFLPPKSYTIS